MGKQRPMTGDDAQDEAEFILTIDPKCPGMSFSFDPACFARYCEMQANHARESGWPEYADIIERHGNRT